MTCEAMLPSFNSLTQSDLIDSHLSKSELVLGERLGESSSMYLGANKLIYVMVEIWCW